MPQKKKEEKRQQREDNKLKKDQEKKQKQELRDQKLAEKAEESKAKEESRIARTCSACHKVCRDLSNITACEECQDYRLCKQCLRDESLFENHLDDCDP